MGKYGNLLLNVGLFTLNSVATKLLTFFLVPLYTAYMPASEYGLTDMSNTVILLLLPLVTLDIADAAVRYIIDDKKNASKYAAVSFVVTALSVIVVSALTPLLDLGIFGGLGKFKGWFVLAYATGAFMTLCGEISRGIGEVKLIPICAVISSIATFVCALVLIAWMGIGIVGYFASVSVGPMLAIIVYLTVGNIGPIAAQGIQGFIRERKGSLGKTFFPMARYALPLIPNSLFWWIGTSINRLFITGMLGISASGLFAAASKIPSLINTAYGIFQQAWQLSAFQESKQDNISAFYTTVFRMVSAGLTVLCALLSLLAPLLASILLKGETYGAWPMIPLLLIASLMNVFNSFYGTVYTSTMHTKYIMRTTVFGALSCIILTPLLIPIMGTYGACVASVIGQSIVFIMRACDSRRYIAFDAGWRALAPTLALLGGQSAVTALQVPRWQLISIFCALLVVILQGHKVLPFFASLKSKFQRVK